LTVIHCSTERNARTLAAVRQTAGNRARCPKLNITTDAAPIGFRLKEQ